MRVVCVKSCRNCRHRLFSFVSPEESCDAADKTSPRRHSSIKSNVVHLLDRFRTKTVKVRLRYFDFWMSCSCVWGSNQVSVDSGAENFTIFGEQRKKLLHLRWISPWNLQAVAVCWMWVTKKKETLLHKHTSTFWCESFKHSFIRLHSRTWYEPEGVEQFLCSRVWSTSSRSEFLLWNVGGLFKKGLAERRHNKETKHACSRKKQNVFNQQQSSGTFQFPWSRFSKNLWTTEPLQNDSAVGEGFKMLRNLVLFLEDACSWRFCWYVFGVQRWFSPPHRLLVTHRCSHSSCVVKRFSLPSQPPYQKREHSFCLVS